MKRKRDKKYFLTIGTCVGLIIVMIISLTNKKTYSYISCMGVVSPDNNACCISQSSFSNEVLYTNEKSAKDACNNYAITNSYEYYTCSIIKHSASNFTWNINIFNGCTK